VKRVVKSLEETFTTVHIANGVDGISKDNAARKLTIAVAPVMLNTLQVPLIDEDNDLLALGLINLSEDIFITFINKDLLQFREEDSCALDVPVDQMLIEASLCEGLRVTLGDLLTVGHQLLSVEALSVLNSLPQVVGNIHSGLVVDAISSGTVELVTHEFQLGTDLFGSFASILVFKTG
jgi:hypothetical protein